MNDFLSASEREDEAFIDFSTFSGKSSPNQKNCFVELEAAYTFSSLFATNFDFN